MNAKRIAPFLAMAISLFGCSSASTTKTIPDQLLGVWTTNAPKYADRYFELKKEAVVFAVGGGKVTQSSVLEVKETRDKTQILYEVTYLTQDGIKEKITFEYEPATGTIRIKNQGKVDWKRGPAGAKVVAVAAKIPPAVPAHTEAKQPPPEPSKEYKQPDYAGPKFTLGSKPDGTKSPLRDPFFSPIKPPAPPQAPINLPGKRGIHISDAKLEGVAKGFNGMIAMVSGFKGQIYFLRPNDTVADGRVARITLNSIVFDETSNDGSGKPTEHEVVKRMGPGAD